MVTPASTLMNMPSDETARTSERLAADLRESSRITELALKKMAADAGVDSSSDTGLLQFD